VKTDQAPVGNMNELFQRPAGFNFRTSYRLLRLGAPGIQIWAKLLRGSHSTFNLKSLSILNQPFKLCEFADQEGRQSELRPAPDQKPLNIEADF
jgi:hypothetical protein